MLYWLYEFWGINIFQYITVRAGVSFFVSFLLCVYLMPKFIKFAKKHKANQPIYNLAPQNHQSKSDTPTMGGGVFLLSGIISTILCVRLDNEFILIALFGVICFGLIGARDDISKIAGKNNHAGLKPKTKLSLQFLFSLALGILLFYFTKLPTDFYIPFYKYPLFDLQIFSIFFWTLVLVASSNAVNLTDGLDGLATVPSIFSLITLGIFAYVSGHAGFSAYLLLPKISAVGEMAVMATALIGSLMGFLWFNCHPAEIFMGDSGSLSIGAFIGYMAVVSKNEVLLIIIGFVFVLETASVILQVGSFKVRKKKLFLMAPIHHHFEVKGWVENKIIVRFWILALLSNLIALTALKIR